MNDGQGGDREEVSVQSTRIIGFEGTANYFISSVLSINATLTLQDHQFTKVEGNRDLEGKILRRQPKFMGNVGLNYDRNNFDANLSYVAIIPSTAFEP